MTGNKRDTLRGVALISVMVVVTVVAAAAAQLLYRQNIDIERSTRIMSREQAFLFAFGLETYARDLLARDNDKYDYEVDFSRYQEEDGLIETWSWPIPNQYMSDEWLDTLRRAGAGRIEARVRDLSGLFNINGVRHAVLSRNKNNQPNKWETLYERTFKNIISTAFANDEENPPDVDALWNSLIDWFDADDEVSDGGAEDDDYLENDPPYITGEGRMAWPEEIRLIQGFEGRVAERLLPLISALPHPGQVKLNINTVDSALLRYMPDEVGRNYASDILTERADEVYFQQEDRMNHFLGDTKAFGNVSVRDFFTVKSDFFLFTACVRFGRDRPIEIQSLLWRKPRDPQQPQRERVVVMQRRMGSGYYKGGECKADSPRPATEISEGS